MSLFRMKHTYLDWAAAAPVTPSAELAFVNALRSYGNPSSPHADGARAKNILEDARTSIAHTLEVKPNGIVYTSGATEANNLAICGHVRALQEGGTAAEDIHLLYLSSAHASVIETVEALSHEGVSVESLELTHGQIDMDALKRQLRPETRLVTVDAVCGETGTRFDTRAVRTVLDACAREHGSSPILLHVDASQAPLALPVSLTRLEADSLALDAQKIGGVRGMGILARRDRFALSPVLFGGGQEHGLRPGTESVAHAAAFAVSLEETRQGSDAFSAQAERSRARLLETLTPALPGMAVNVGKRGVPHILNLSLPGRDTDYLVMLLDKAGFSVATKSACESDSENGSRAVRALSGDDARARSTLRVSWGPTTRTRDLDRFAAELIRCVRFLDSA